VNNLLSNAVKYSPPGGTVYLTCAPGDTGKDEVVISVRDHGPGIPADAQDRLFTKFYRVDSSSTRQVGGTGLGLAIAKAIVEQHGGRIWVDSAPGAGSTFSFALPVAAGVGGTAPAPAGRRRRGSRKEIGAAAMAMILVVDDEPDVVEIVRFRLERDGHTIVSAADGPTGLVTAFTRSPDLVILDVMMPGIDGFEVLRRMKNDPRTAHTPVIMLTAKADFSSVAQGWNMDVDNYVTKPFEVDELSNIVKNVLTYRGKIAA
jgi:CheY-like chemotaxis protein